MADISVRDTVQVRLGRPTMSVLRDVFGVQSVNSAGTRTRSLRQQLARIQDDQFVRVACVTVRPLGGSANPYVNLQRDLDNADDALFQSCGVWIYCVGSGVVETGELGVNGVLDQDDCNAGWLLDFIGIGDHDVSAEEDDLFDLGRSLGANIVGYFIPGAVSGLAGCAAHPGGRRGFWVSMAGSSQWTFGHELGHIVGDLGHSGDNRNLMFTPTASIVASPPEVSDVQCFLPLLGGVVHDPDVEGQFDGIPPADTPIGSGPPPIADELVVEQALVAECGNPLLERRAVNPTTRALLEANAEDPSNESSRRQRAVYLLGLWPDDRTAELLTRVMPTLDEPGRLGAAVTLGRIGTAESINGLIELAKDASPDVRRIAVERLGRTDAPEARRVLSEVASDDSSDFVRARARDAVRR